MQGIYRILFSMLRSSICLLLVGISVIWAQSAGSTTAIVNGVITDQQGAVLGGVSITAKNLDTNQTREATSAEDGRYKLLQLPPGSYEFAISAEGFSTEMARVTLVLGTSTELNFAMQVGSTANIVEVQADNLIEDGKTENSTNIDSGLISNLPINRRNFLDFSLTTPRVTMDRAPVQGASATSGLSVNGQNARSNNITIDGLDNNDIASNSVRSTFSQDAVREFQVVSDSYSAEFGRALGGVINIVTKGGGKDFHGSLFFFNRNDSTSARDVFAPFKPEFKQYQYGATLSGPIKKDRIFFFTSFEHLSVKQNNFVTITNSTVQSVRNLGFPINNGPLPVGSGTTTFLGRSDIKINSNDNLYIRYNFGGSYNGALEPFGGLVAQSNSGVQNLKDNSFALANTYINSRLNLVNETRFFAGFRKQSVTPVDPGPQIRIVAPEGFITVGRATFVPQFREERIVQFVDNVTLSRGRQTLKFGIDYIRNDLPDKKTNVPIFPGGLVFFLPLNFSAVTGIPGLPSFTGLEAFDPSLRSPVQRAFLGLLANQLPILAPGFPANQPLADLPLPSAYAQGFGDTSLVVPQTLFATFVQDDIKILPNFILKLGLRYDINRIRFEPNNNGNVAPRVAINYRPTKLPNLSFHAAYGLFFSSVRVVGVAFAVQTTQSQALKLPIQLFPFSILSFAQPGHKFPDSNAGLPPGETLVPQFSQSFKYQKDLRNSYAQQINAGVDYLLGKNTVFSASYDFVRGIKLFSPRNINPVVQANNPNPAVNALVGRVDPTTGDVFEYESSFDSYFHALTLSLNRRLTNHVGVLANYTFSKSIDNFIDVRTDLQEAVDPLNPRQERGLSLQDVRSRFVLSGIFDLNFTKNVFLTGFQLSTIMTLNSGRPYNLLAGVDLNRNNDNPVGDRPLIGSAPVGRNAGVTPGFASVDVRLTRTITFKDQYQIQGFVEAFNLFNRVNISDINRVFPPNAQGMFNLPRNNGRFIAPRDRYTNAFSPRQFQFGFRVSF